MAPPTTVSKKKKQITKTPATNELSNEQKIARMANIRDALLNMLQTNGSPISPKKANGGDKKGEQVGDRNNLQRPPNIGTVTAIHIPHTASNNHTTSHKLRVLDPIKVAN